MLSAISGEPMPEKQVDVLTEREEENDDNKTFNSSADSATATSFSKARVAQAIAFYTVSDLVMPEQPWKCITTHMENNENNTTKL